MQRSPAAPQLLWGYLNLVVSIYLVVFRFGEYLGFDKILNIQKKFKSNHLKNGPNPNTNKKSKSKSNRNHQIQKHSSENVPFTLETIF